MITEETTDTLAEFRRRLPPRVNRQLRDTIRVAILVNRAVHTMGWDVEALAAECVRDHDPKVRNPAGIVMHRLEWCAENEPPDRHRPKVLPFCSPDCRERGGLIEDPKTGLPVGKCECRTP